MGVVAVLLGACVSHGEMARLGAADFGKRFEEHRKQAENLDYPGLLSKLGINPASDQPPPFDATQVRYFTEAARALGLVDSEMRAFKQHGFVMVDHGQSLSMGRVYLEIYKADLPVFVSTDSILHALHRSYDQVLMDIESSAMIPGLESALAAIGEEVCRLLQQPELRQSATDLLLFTSVGRQLLAAGTPRAKAGTEIPLACGPTSNAGEVLEKINRLQADRMDAGTSLYGRSRVVDWSQFRPRGHYLHSSWLEAYFRAMMWLGRVDLAWSLDVDRELRDAALLVLLVGKTGQSRRLEAMSRVLDFMVGRADSSGLPEMKAALELAKIDTPDALVSAGGLQKLRAAIDKVPMTAQQIRSEALPSDPSSSHETPLPSAFQLLGQRFVLDAFVLSKVVYDSIVFHGRKQDRSMPTGLDVMAGLGSNEAILQLEPQLRQYNYAANLLAARRLLDGLPRTEWQSNAYVRWLDALRRLFLPPDSDKLPSVMRSREWQRKELQTAAASWAELRHDTVLYAKQSYTASAICEYPEGYVEPYPAFFDALANLAREAADVLGNADLYPQVDKLPDYVKQLRRRRAEFFGRFATIMRQLEGIADKELHAQPLNAEEKTLLKDVVVEHRSGGGCSSFPRFRYTGWYADLYYNGAVAEPEPTVADVHTAGNVFLEEGVGNTRYLLVAVDSQQDRAVYIGPAYSYYEFTSRVRLTDEEWERMIPTTPPASFSAGFALPAASRSMIYPPKAPAPAPSPQPVLPPPPSPAPAPVEAPDLGGGE